MTGIVLVSFADRGIGKRSKSKVLLNVTTTHSFKADLFQNMKNGLQYKGSLLSDIQRYQNSMIATELVTYQKGNSIYIIPYKQKMIVPEMSQGYTGIKLVIKSK